MKAIHKTLPLYFQRRRTVVLYPKDTENESNSQLINCTNIEELVVLYPKDTEKMETIHNVGNCYYKFRPAVVLYPKDTEK